MKKQIVVGINDSYFKDLGDFTSDGNVSIMVGGEVRLAIAQERVSRKKYDGRFDDALSFALDKLKISKEDVDAVSVVGFAVSLEDSKDHEIVKNHVRDYFKQDIPITYLRSHHEAHAWLAVAQSGFPRALVAVLDNSGNVIEYSDDKTLENARSEQTSYYLWEKNRLELVHRDHDGFSAVGYGRLYSKVTRYIGFPSYHQSGKTMGLAPIGKDIPIPESWAAYETVDGRETTRLTHASRSPDGLKDLSDWFQEQNGVKLHGPYDAGPVCREQILLARWVQASLESSVVRQIGALVEKHRIRKICITGGVGLNSVMNRRVQESTECEMFVPSSPGDAGLSLGALAYFSHFVNKTELKLGRNPFYGPDYGEDEIIAVLKKEPRVTFKESVSVVKDTARLLHEGNVVAWFQGRSEFGPRALGNRSILADPSNPWMKEVVNHRIKKREWYRPFAPSVPAEFVQEYFDTRNDAFEYMMKTAELKNGVGKEIPSVVHYDNSARLQSVDKAINPRYHELILEFSSLGHLPIILNTSFNLGGMPLVESPQDAIDCFFLTDAIDLLVLNNFIVEKNNL